MNTEQKLNRLIELASAGLWNNYPHPDDMHKKQHDEFNEIVTDLKACIQVEDTNPTWQELKEIIESGLSVSDDMRYSNYNKAGLIASTLRLKFNIKNK